LGAQDQVRTFASSHVGYMTWLFTYTALQVCSSLNAMVSCPLLDIPTELLIQILSYLSCDNLCPLQRTCRRFEDIISGTPYLEYLLLTGIDNVDDL